MSEFRESIASGFQRSVPPAPTEWACYATSDIAKAGNGLSFDPLLAYFSFPRSLVAEIRPGRRLAYPAGEDRTRLLTGSKLEPEGGGL